MPITKKPMAIATEPDAFRPPNIPLSLSSLSVSFSPFSSASRMLSITISRKLSVKSVYFGEGTRPRVPRSAPSPNALKLILPIAERWFKTQETL